MSNQIDVLDGVAGKIPNFKINTGSDADMNYMLAMHNNLVQYVHLIDIYGPCIVGASNWNNTNNMENIVVTMQVCSMIGFYH